MTNVPTAYLIPGRGERLDGALGFVLHEEGRSVTGRELRGDFAALRFPDQLATIADDLADGFWSEDAVLAGRSYGAYLLLHCLAEREPFPGRLLLFSPVLGAGVRPGGSFGSRPPRASKLLKMAQAGTFPAPAALEIHTGAADEGCNPALAREIFGEVPGADLFVVPDMGHELDPEYVWRAVRRFLKGGG